MGINLGSVPAPLWHTAAMARQSDFQVPSILGIRLLRRVLCTFAVSGAMLLHGQEATPPTFHVYVNLVQIPVLVLPSSGESVTPIAESRFAISLDSGPKFRPTH